MGWAWDGGMAPPASGALPHSLLLSPCSSALMESLINPLQDRIEDWKKTANQLDKDHAKGMGGDRMELCRVAALLGRGAL